MRNYLKFKHKENFVAITVPSDVTWCYLVENPMADSYIGVKLCEVLNLNPDGYFVKYGKGNHPNTPVPEGCGIMACINHSCQYYNPESFYAVQVETNPIYLGILSKMTEEECQNISKGKNYIYEELFYNDFPVEKKEYDYLIIGVENNIV